MIEGSAIHTEKESATMKRIFLAVFGFFLSLALMPHDGWAAEWAPRDKAVFYQDGCGGGNYLELEEGEYSDLRNNRTGEPGSQNWNDQISCMAIGSGISKVIVYEHINFEGRSKEFTRSWGWSGSTQSLAGGWWNDKISSIKVVGMGSSSPWGEPVPRDKAVFYQDGGCDGGNYVELKEGEYADLRALRVSGSGSSTWNDRISCMAIGSDISKVIVYEHINFGGMSKEFTRSRGGSGSSWDLSGEWWNDKISSIEVIGAESSNPWEKPVPRDKAVFYQDNDCRGGTSIELREGKYPDLTKHTVGKSGSATWNDRISCIAIGSDITKVVVYEHVNYGGRSKEFTRSSVKSEGSWSLGDGWWNDRISSIVVFGPGSSSPWNRPASRDKAVFYDEDGCEGGSYVELKEGEYPDLREVKVKGSSSATWNDRISCLTIGSDISKVILYEHPNFEGKSKVLTRSPGDPDLSWSLLGGWSNNKVTSLKVIGVEPASPWDGSAPRNKAVFYQDSCGAGNYVALGKGEYPDLRELTLTGSSSATWNDRISCITIGAGVTRVIVYEHPNFEGKSREFTRSWAGPDTNWSLSGLWCNDKVTSLKVQ
jgi:hypothetical protein